MADTYDPTTLKEVRQRADDLAGLYSGYVSMCRRVDRMYLMEWEDQPDSAVLKITISPSARNSAVGAVRLMTATDPVVSVPFDKSSKDAKEKSEKVEKFMAAALDQSGRVRGNPVHFSAVTSAILYGRMDLAVTRTSDLQAWAKGGSKAAEMRMERIAMRTPLLFDVFDPKSGFPEYDEFGMSAYFRKVKLKAGAVLDRWGEAGLAVIGGSAGRFDDVDYCDYWDHEKHVVWIDGKEGVLLAENHNLPTIPIISQVTEGEKFFERPEQQIQPFLYGLDKSGLWNRQNLSLTVLYTMIFAIGANPMFLHQSASDDTDLAVDYSVPGGVVKLRPGESYQPLLKQVIDPSLMSGLEVADKLEGETTMYKQALGQPLGGSPSFSMVSLLSQSGRLPLISPQKRGGWGMGSILEAGLLILRDGGKATNVKSAGEVLSLKASDIPADVMVDCKLDVSLPQDKLGNANLANIVTQNKLMSRRWARENILGEGQSDQMTQEIWTEDTEDLFYQFLTAKYGPQIQQLLQQSMSAQPQQGAPVQPGGPGAGMPTGQPSPVGDPMQGGLPQAMGGLLPAQGPDMGGGQGLPPELAGMMGGMV